MITTQQKIEALTKNEFEFLLNNPECLHLEAEFFANGGFHSFSKKDIDKKYKEEFGD